MKDSRKIYLLRHEERYNTISFETPLTPEGKYKAINNIMPILEQLEIGQIYCSPFIRTLQTIQPFCEKTGKKVNLEWALVESNPNNPIIPSSFNRIINNKYKPFITFCNSEDTSLLSFERLSEKVSRFLESLDKNDNILLVTHMPVINAILYAKGMKEYNINTYHRPGALLCIEKKTASK